MGCGHLWPHFTHEETEAVRLGDLPKVIWLEWKAMGKLKFSHRLEGPEQGSASLFNNHSVPSVYQFPQKSCPSMVQWPCVCLYSHYTLYSDMIWPL